MKISNFTFKGEEDTDIYVYKYEPIEKENINGIVQISHGMSEEAGRYKRFANYLTDNGYIVYINDHRGHGKSAENINRIGILAQKDGIHCIVKDLNKLTKIIKTENNGLPIFLFSHSMGSFAAQKYIIDYSEDIDGVILSGTNGLHGIEVDLGFLVAKVMSKIQGREKKAYLIDKLAFGGFNKKFKPNKSEFDWLSRDFKEVEKYIENEYCGVVFSNGYFYDLFKLFKEIRNINNLKKINSKLPIYIFAGDKDPVGKFGKGITKLYENYKKVGIENVEFKLYSGGRHEMLNEINKDEVINDTINWIKQNNKLTNQ
ncbi:MULTISPECIES: alpha/beta hydrolase [Peptostreptococcaceae]|uniref:Alpha/beta fold hydrolase n=2 Tax=Paraclostridium bifermentans TaxID=1490 RepID=A0A5P3XD53_PARBF|nr:MULTISPECIES: alpha/beta hydrolase [Paraclostridium]MDV8112831.1 alpha/beta hydrolase [Bacillus sp. BAU-SS-2023]MBZ6004521.1 lysophospholipase [Paraclostridium bifermentans]MCE9675181.1 alpha/beta hydrolase [Paraclostridium bifermentans]MDU0298189.1 lysophospholipase [Paraclostridium sp. MRS3W1]QEZ67533.1 alpha/beta fold hydrolase [Paraclostridium bifermentans]